MIVKLFTAKLAEVSDAAVRAVLTDLCLLYALFGIGRNAGDFLQVSVFPSTPQLWSQAHCLQMCFKCQAVWMLEV